MRSVTLAFIILLLTASSGPVLAHSNNATGPNDFVTTSASVSNSFHGEYLMAKNGADDGADDVGDDHGAD